MKAIVQDAYGSADVLTLREIERPDVRDDEVRIRVVAAGVDRGALHLMTGVPYLMRILGVGLRVPKTRVPGTNVAGHVDAVGKDVTRFQQGDEVYGTCKGSFAEYACARGNSLRRNRRASRLSRWPEYLMLASRHFRPYATTGRSNLGRRC